MLYSIWHHSAQTTEVSTRLTVIFIKGPPFRMQKTRLMTTLTERRQVCWLIWHFALLLLQPSTSLYYISRSSGYQNIEDWHRNPIFNMREINQLSSPPLLTRSASVLSQKPARQPFAANQKAKLENFKFKPRPNQNSPTHGEHDGGDLEWSGMK